MAVQTTMKTFMGRAPALDADDMVADFAWKPRVIAKTADYTVTQQESGTFFTTEGATANVNFTLPTAASGPWIFWFFCAEDFNMTITAETADTMVAFNDVAADSIAYSTASEKVGGAAMVFSSGGSVVYAVVHLGHESQTITVAT